MKKYENFCAALNNMKEIYKYEPPYNTVVRSEERRVGKECRL